MSSKMKTAVFTDKKQVEIEECKRPSASGNKVLIKVDAAAICTWEQRVYTGVNKVEFPFIGGQRWETKSTGTNGALGIRWL